MQLSQGTKSLLDLTKKAYNGEVMLPDFQRNFVWTRQDVEELLKSLLEDMFIGTFLVHNVDPSNPPFKTIAIEGAKLVNPDYRANSNLLILDGQQRLSSYFYALYCPETALKNVSHPYRFFIKIDELLNDNIDDAVFSWSIHYRKYQALLNNDGVYDMQTLKKEILIPFSFLKDDFTEIWYEYYKEDFSDKEGRKIRAYINNVINYNVLTLDVPLGEKPETIAVLFEKINRTGVKLSVFDLLTARLYKFLNLREEWETSFDTYSNIQKFALDNKRDTTVPYYFIQAIALYENLSIKARDMLKINEKHINKTIWHETAKVLNDDVLERLLDKNEYGIVDVNKWLPYKPMTVVMLALFKNSKKDISKINQWYWSAVFSERYAGSTEAKLTKDYKELLKWFNDSEKIPEVVVEMRNILYKTFTIHDKKYAGNSVYKGVFNLLFMHDAKDLYENDKLKFSTDELDDHHIFPKKFLENKGVEVDWDMVANRTLIGSKTNKRISKKAPRVYLQEMLENNENDEKSVKAILEKHFIDNAMYKILLSVDEISTKEDITKAFEDFVERREKIIQNHIADMIGFKEIGKDEEN